MCFDTTQVIRFSCYRSNIRVQGVTSSTWWSPFINLIMYLQGSFHQILIKFEINIFIHHWKLTMDFHIKNTGQLFSLLNNTGQQKTYLFWCLHFRTDFIYILGAKSKYLIYFSLSVQRIFYYFSFCVGIQIEKGLA